MRLFKWEDENKLDVPVSIMINFSFCLVYLTCVWYEVELAKSPKWHVGDMIKFVGCQNMFMTKYYLL